MSGHHFHIVIIISQVSGMAGDKWHQTGVRW